MSATLMMSNAVACIDDHSRAVTNIQVHCRILVKIIPQSSKNVRNCEEGGGGNRISEDQIKHYLSATLGDAPQPKWGVPEGWSGYLAGIYHLLLFDLKIYLSRLYNCLDELCQADPPSDFFQVMKLQKAKNSTWPKIYQLCDSGQHHLTLYWQQIAQKPKEMGNLSWIDSRLCLSQESLQDRFAKISCPLIVGLNLQNQFMDANLAIWLFGIRTKHLLLI